MLAPQTAYRWRLNKIMKTNKAKISSTNGLEIEIETNKASIISTILRLIKLHIKIF